MVWGWYTDRAHSPGVLCQLDTGVSIGLGRRRIGFEVCTEGAKIIETGQVSGLFLPRNGNDRESVLGRVARA